MEEEYSTPPELLNNVQKLAQERARIRNKIAAAMSPSLPADDTLLPSNPFDALEQLERARDIAETQVARPDPPKLAAETPPVPPHSNQPIKQTSKSSENVVIQPELPEPASKLPPQFDQQPIKQAGKISEDPISEPARLGKAGEKKIAEVPSLPPRLPFPGGMSGRNRYIAIGSGLLICVLLLSGIFWLVQRSQAASNASLQPTPIVRTPTAQKSTPIPTATPTPLPTPTPTKKAQPPVTLSFEDGGTGGWHSSSQDGTIDSVENTDTSRAKDGKHVLMVTYDSDDDHSYPCVGTNNLPGTLKAKDTITASILKQEGDNVKAALYVVDKAGKWYTSTAYSLVEKSDLWYSMTYTVPSTFPGSAKHVGVILYGDNAVVYIDSVGWHE